MFDHDPISRTHRSGTLFWRFETGLWGVLSGKYLGFQVCSPNVFDRSSRTVACDRENGTGFKPSILYVADRDPRFLDADMLMDETNLDRDVVK